MSLVKRSLVPIHDSGKANNPDITLRRKVAQIRRSYIILSHARNVQRHFYSLDRCFERDGSQHISNCETALQARDVRLRSILWRSPPAHLQPPTSTLPPCHSPALLRRAQDVLDVSTYIAGDQIYLHASPSRLFAGALTLGPVLGPRE